MEPARVLPASTKDPPDRRVVMPMVRALKIPKFLAQVAPALHLLNVTHALASVLNMNHVLALVPTVNHALLEPGLASSALAKVSP